MVDTLWLVYLIITTILISILTVLCTYYIVTYYKKSRNEECCKERHTYIIEILTLIVLCVSLCNTYTTVFDPSSFLIQIYFYITGIIIVALITKYCENIYNLHYDIQLSKSIREHKWKSIIDNKPTNNWYILNKKKWGSKRFIRKIGNAFIVFQFMVPTSVAITAQFFVGNSKIYNILSGLTYVVMAPIFIPVILMIVLYHRVKSFDDVFLVIKQCKRNAYIIGIGTALGIIFAVLHSISEITQKHTIMFGILADFSSWIGFPMNILNNTYWVIKNVIDKQSRKNNSKQTLTINVKDVLRNPDTTDIFMAHLSTGICIRSVYIYNLCTHVYIAILIFRIFNGNIAVIY